MSKRTSLLVAGSLLAFGCQSNVAPVASSAPSTASTAPSVAPATSSAPATAVPEAAGDATQNKAPAWTIGKWSASATTRATQLQLPGNQGVQIAWLKDKSQQHSGEVKLSLTLKAPGIVSGELSGALGTLDLAGVWPAQGPLHLELRPSHDGAEVFHGTLTLTWDAEKQRATGELRATSGDGRWLRSAELEVTRAS